MNRQETKLKRPASLLTASNIYKQYEMGKNETLDVLKGVDIEIRSGEILTIIGHSGAGKSTLLHILGALDRPTRGTLNFKGKALNRLNDAALAKFRNAQYGFVFQFHHLMPEFSALENVAMPGLIAGRIKDDVYTSSEALLKKVGLSKRLNHKPSELSGGEQQRVAFARALINNPVMIMADEPSGNLDLKNSLALQDLMWGMVREKQTTFVVVTHNQELAKKADRVIELYDGQIRKDNHPVNNQSL